MKIFPHSKEKHLVRTRFKYQRNDLIQNALRDRDIFVNFLSQCGKQYVDLSKNDEMPIVFDLPALPCEKKLSVLYWQPLKNVIQQRVRVYPRKIRG